MKTSSQTVRLLRAALIGALSLSGSCSSPPDYEGTALLGGVDCDPMVPTQCGFPFPSSVYLVSDKKTATGRRVAFGGGTLPNYGGGSTTDPSQWDDSDGFSPGNAAMTHLPGATDTGLAPIDDPGKSLLPSSPTVLIEAETGAWVPHFAELDRSHADDSQRALIIRPVVRLKDATRYVVAIRRVVDSTGAALAPSPIFLALRDETPHSDPSVERRRRMYEDVFGRLKKAGVERGDLQISWDYWTASRENNTGAMVRMRDDALRHVGEEGPPYEIVSVESPAMVGGNESPFLWKRIVARMTVPLFLDDPGIRGRLVRGPDGWPLQNGTAQYDVLILVPKSVQTQGPAPLLQNGHGAMGSKTEGQNGYVAEFADRYNHVAFSVDLIGMADEDIDGLVKSISGDIGGLRANADRAHQGMINSLLAMRMMKGRFWKDPAVQLSGRSVIDPTMAAYRGDSQGGVYGVTYMALSTDVTRGLISVAGIPYSFLLNRSTLLNRLETIISIVYPRPLDRQLAVGLLQMHWDRGEANGFAPYVTANPLPGTPVHTVLMHVGISDSEISEYGSHILARTLGAKSLGPAVRPIWGIAEANAPSTSSAMVEFSFGLPSVPKTNIPPPVPVSDPHNIVRLLEPAQQQADKFFREGVIDQFCHGICDCGSAEEEGNCDRFR